MLAAILGTAAAGWFARRVWAWRLTVGVIVTQILGNLVNIILGRYLEAISGAMIATALLFYLLQARVRAAFSVGSK